MGNELDTVKIGNYIAEKRRTLGLTQQGLADRLNVTNKAVSKWETGQGAPDIGTLPQFAAVLQVTVDEILNGENAPRQAENTSKPPAEEGGNEPPAFTMQTALSREFLLLCAKMRWQSFHVGLRLANLTAGILLLALAVAGAGVSRLTDHSVSQVIPAICLVTGACFLALQAEGYRLFKSVRESRTEEARTFQFFDDRFTVTEAGSEKSWRYGNVTQLLESRECFLLLCGR